MTDKAYIVANKEQERDVINMLYADGFYWDGHSNNDNWTPRIGWGLLWHGFPYMITTGDDKYIRWGEARHSDKKFVIYDGRKESKMKINEKVYKALDNWKEHGDFTNYSVTGSDISNLPVVVDEWWKHNSELSVKEKNDRLLAIVRFANGEQPFEVEKPKKWVVRSKGTDDDGEYWWLSVCEIYGLKRAYYKHTY